MSEFDLEIQETDAPKPSREPVKPLPSLWKTESDSDLDEGLESGDPGKPGKKSSEATDEAVTKSPGKPSSPAVKAKKPRGKESLVAAEKPDKKVLLEETPSLDTY